MEAVMEFIQANAHIAPYIIFGLLMLAGFNVPVSEDAMLFISALLASQNPPLLIPLFVAVFLGAYLSDLVCYYVMGRVLGQRIFKLKFFAKMVSQEQIQRISHFYEKYGVLTLILGRFIPFGVRNGLFFTAGLGRMNAWKFALADLLACSLSCTTFFYLYYRYGQTVIAYVKQGNQVLFAVFLAVVLGCYIRKKTNTKTT